MIREREVVADPLAIARGIATGVVLGALVWWPIIATTIRLAR